MDCIVHGIEKSQTGLSDFHTPQLTRSHVALPSPSAPNLSLLAYHGLAKLAVSCFRLHSEQLFFLQKGLLQTA